jgi:hypothetical protein
MFVYARPPRKTFENRCASPCLMELVSPAGSVQRHARTFTSHHIEQSSAKLERAHFAGHKELLGLLVSSRNKSCLRLSVTLTKEPGFIYFRPMYSQKLGRYKYSPCEEIDCPVEKSHRPAISSHRNMRFALCCLQRRHMGFDWETEAVR